MKHDPVTKLRSQLTFKDNLKMHFFGLNSLTCTTEISQPTFPVSKGCCKIFLNHTLKIVKYGNCEIGVVVIIMSIC